MLMLFLFNVFLLRSLLKTPQNRPFFFFFLLEKLLDVGEHPEASGSCLERGLPLMRFFFSPNNLELKEMKETVITVLFV